MCDALEVSRASFYRWLDCAPGKEQDCDLREEMERIALAWPSYGSRRIREELQSRGWPLGRERVQRLLREQGLLCLRRPTSWLVTTASRHALPVFPNLAASVTLTGLDQLWVADITYIRLPQDFVFLAAILDAFSRRVIGWALERSLEAKLCVAALQQALRRRPVQLGLIHHSDRGVQYCSREYVDILARHGIVGSMSRKGNPFDNARAESFWKTLKSEQVYREEYRTFEHARRDISRFIDSIYNRRRLHSALGYQSPVEFEKTLHQEVSK
jgi:transposase InsO family protein